MTSLFYNKEGIGDVLIFHLLKENADEVKTERKGDWALILKEGTEELIGLNLFNASQKFEALEQVKGKWTPSQADLEKLTALLKEELGIELSFDQRPDFLIGYVEELTPHPDADKLKVCQVNLGDQTLQIVCGAPNVEAGQKVVVARVGALMPGGLVIKDAELRGVASSGMICSARELALPNAPQKKGIYVLPDEAPVGEGFWSYQDQLLTTK
ncbi:DUF4479 domain-containing protein [Pullulanibacillus sp. KACC 23026]|uniref:YtpR family tRNA-binding protein n=1 Tax=Pullulanibacillus sp. KACC 23026 TaxID=3028315 RepID=UPI0023B0BB3D|nr:DUF4479 domain-containing protein [Pullulanibacillus sp. KACC 23026]WEG13864.1 DUF4479 domain-containing protein [Pullulanibacillus sp. KACC 23026]